MGNTERKLEAEFEKEVITDERRNEGKHFKLWPAQTVSPQMERILA